MSVNAFRRSLFIMSFVFGILVSWFFKRALRKETSINSVNSLKKNLIYSQLFVFILMTMIYMLEHYLKRLTMALQ